MALTVPAAVVGGVIGGLPGVLAAGSFGLLGTAIQLAAGRMMTTRTDAPLREFMQGWAGGMGLRLAGVVLVGVVIWLDSARFPPIPAALGYIGVLVPLLFLEARRV